MPDLTNAITQLCVLTDYEQILFGYRLEPIAIKIRKFDGNVSHSYSYWIILCLKSLFVWRVKWTMVLIWLECYEQMCEICHWVILTCQDHVHFRFQWGIDISILYHVCGWINPLVNWWRCVKTEHLFWGGMSADFEICSRLKYTNSRMVWMLQQWWS